jgi:hypothetical protein
LSFFIPIFVSFQSHTNKLTTMAIPFDTLKMIQFNKADILLEIHTNMLRMGAEFEDTSELEEKIYTGEIFEELLDYAEINLATFELSSEAIEQLKELIILCENFQYVHII